ncbi:MAG TPA: hypothetical protein VND93_10830, partial [Myxococcales bacterium]|nr:hypothetical protein [Myxococcales bacterium]
MRSIHQSLAILLVLFAGPSVRAGSPDASGARGPSDPALTVSAADRAAEAARLTALGLRVPDGGIVLERPWDQPFTRRSFV